MTDKKLWAGIVDAYSTGNQLAPLLRNRGFRVAHIQSSRDICPIYKDSFQPEDFDHLLVHEHLPETLVQLKKLSPRFIITGAESGVFLSDQLSHHLKLPGNKPESSPARRNKFMMTEALRAHGVLAVKDLLSDSLEEIQHWAEKCAGWPVVLKPTSSAGSDSVFFCDDPTGLRTGFQAIMGKKNRLHIENEKVLAQTCLMGQEYIVDSVSWAGDHLISEIWKVHKKQVPSGNIAYDIERLIPWEGSEQEKLISYTKRVLDALGIQFGPAHSEICLTREGPVLIESGARMHGGISCPAVEEGLGNSHPGLTSKAYADPEGFRQELDSQAYRIKKHIYVVTLISGHQGRLQGYGKMEKIRQMKSFHSVISLPPLQSEIKKTVDLFSSPGIIYLTHKDTDVLEKDYRQIRHWEKNGLFELSTIHQAT